MGEAKQRAERANDQKTIEASDQERIACLMFFGNVNLFPIPENRIQQRRYNRFWDDFDLDGADRVAMEAARKNGGNIQAISTHSSELVEFRTTADVVEFFLANTDGKVPALWSRYVLRLAERMLGMNDGTYRAPSEGPTPPEMPDV